MAANGDELFKTTLMGGFDKDDVTRYIKKMREESYAEKSKILLLVKAKDKKIEELNARLDKKDAEIRKLEQDIKEKYQSYIDHYDSIGRLVYDAQVRSNQMIDEAQNESDKIRAAARKAAKECLDSVQKEIDDRLLEGKKKYLAVQEELNEIVELINKLQRRFMQSYKSVHSIISIIPESLQELEEDEMETAALTFSELEQQTIDRDLSLELELELAQVEDRAAIERAAAEIAPVFSTDLENLPETAAENEGSAEAGGDTKVVVKRMSDEAANAPESTIAGEEVEKVDAADTEATGDNAAGMSADSVGAGTVGETEADMADTADAATVENPVAGAAQNAGTDETTETVKTTVKSQASEVREAVEYLDSADDFFDEEDEFEEEPREIAPASTAPNTAPEECFDEEDTEEELRLLDEQIQKLLAAEENKELLTRGE